MTWVTKKKCRKVTGYTDGQIKARIQRHWRQGIEWAYVHDLQMIDLDAIERRAAELAAVQCTERPTRRKIARRVVKLK